MRSLCTELLIKYPAHDFVLVTLKTLTQLAAATLVDIPEQVSGVRITILPVPRSHLTWYFASGPYIKGELRIFQVLQGGGELTY